MRLRSLASILTLVVLVTAACGGSTPAASAPASSAPAAAASTAPAASATPAATSATAAYDKAVADLVAAAQKEGSFQLYTALDPDTAASLADAFQKKYGVKMEFTRLTSGPLTARYASEWQSGVYTADLIIISADPFLDDALAKGWLKKIDEKLLPVVPQLPKRFVYPSSVALGIARLSNFAVNTKLVPAEKTPAKWEDLLQPQWKNQLFTTDPKSVPVELALFMTLAEKYGDNYVKQLAAQGIGYQASMVNGIQLIAAGERQGGFGTTQVHLNPLLVSAPTAPVKLIPLQGLDFGYEWRAGLNTKSKGQNAAQLFVNWLLTAEGQLLLNKTVGNSVRPEVNVPGYAPLANDFISLDTAKALKDRARILALLGLTE